MKAIVSTPNPNQLLALVNKNYQLEATYVPTDFVPLDVTLSTFALTGTNYLRRDAADATENSLKRQKRKGLSFYYGQVTFPMKHRKKIMNKICMKWEWNMQKKLV